MQINKIKIDNVKGVSSLEFAPKKINLVVGRNNTGKTSVLEAIYLLFNPEDIGQMCGKYIQDIIRTGAEYSEIAADMNKSKKKLKVSKPEKNEVVYQLKKDIIERFIRILKKYIALNLPENTIDMEKIRHELENKTDEIIIPDIINTISKKSMCLLKDSKYKTVKYHLSFSEYSRILRILYPISLDIFRQIFKQITTKPLNKKVLSDDEILSVEKANMLEMFSLFEHPAKISEGKYAVLIKNLLDVKFESEEKDAEIKRRIRNIESTIKKYNLIENLDRLDFDYVAFKDDEKLTFVPFEFLGDGFKAIIGLLWYLSSQNIKNKIVLLDEPEMHMHPGYIKELVKFIIKTSRDANIQFFISTHSTDVVDIFLDADIFSKEERKYLEKELLVLRMGKIDGQNLSEYLNYEEAKYTKDKLLLDLREI